MIVEIPKIAPEIDWNTETKTLGKVETKVETENHMWVTARKMSIPVRQMSTSHINNCIRCWKGRGNMSIPHGYLGGKAKWLNIFNQELTSRN